MKVFVPWLLSLLIINSTSIVFAEFITIDTDVSTTVLGSEITIDVNLKNRGDESAYEITVAAFLRSVKISSCTISKLEPDAETVLTLRSEIAGGFLRTIVPLSIYYKDGKGHPFSVLSYAVATYFGHETPRVLATIEPIKLARRNTVILTAKSMDGEPHHMGIKIIVPNELSVSPKTRQVDIPSIGEVYASFKLVNFGAVPNSTYVILALLSEEREKGIYEDVALGKARIIVPKSIVKILSGNSVLWILGFLIVCYALYQLISARKRNSV